MGWGVGVGAAWEGSWLVPRAQSSLVIYAVAVLRIVRRRLTQHFDEGSEERRHLLSLLLIFPARTLKPRIPDSQAKISRIPNPDCLLYMGQLKHTYINVFVGSGIS